MIQCYDNSKITWANIINAVQDIGSTNDIGPTVVDIGSTVD